jgi:hypothetical protein
MKQFCINLDEKTNKLLEKYSTTHSIPKSVAVRMIVNDFFLKLEGN